MHKQLHKVSNEDNDKYYIVVLCDSFNFMNFITNRFPPNIL